MPYERYMDIMQMFVPVGAVGARVGEVFLCEESQNNGAISRDHRSLVLRPSCTSMFGHSLRFVPPLTIVSLRPSQALALPRRALGDMHSLVRAKATPNTAY